ncbi:ABC transporter ATP-binding protein [Candidatus Margulisiibacteriota bacterium]
MLKINNLKTCFKVKNQVITAVDGVSFEIPENKIIGLVGESGSGKTVTALSILNLLANNGWIEDGKISWKGQDLSALNNNELRQIRGTEIGMIFQNPMAALNPVFSIGNQLIETILLHRNVTKKEALEIAIDLLIKVNIPDPEARLSEYPHQFSMGMCQRIMIALTLAMKPKLIIADEPTASLDVTIQAQMLDLLEQLQREYKLSVLMISHDLGIIAQYCDYIIVMYLGKIVEEGTPKQVFKNPLHPYTQALISAIPVPDPEKAKPVIKLKGDFPGIINLPKGCRFHPRCPKVMDKCKKIQPELENKNQQKVACWL